MRRNNPKLTFRDGTTVLLHGDLVSFLHEKDTRILHRHFNKAEWQALRRITYGGSECLNTPSNSFLDALESAGILIRSEKDNRPEFILEESPQLLHMLVMITNRCNMNCRYCYTEANNPLSEGELSQEQWKDFFEEVHLKSKFVSQNISFTGGEPTLYPNFAGLLRSLNSKYKIEVTSNGRVLDAGVLKALSESSSLVSFNLSIDSRYPEQDEILRGERTYVSRIKTLKRLNKERIPVCVSSVISHLTLQSLEETTRFFLSEFPGIKIKYVPLTKMGRAVELEDKYFLTTEDAKKYIEIVLRLRSEFKDRILTDPSSFSEDLRAGHWSGRCAQMKYDSEKTLFRQFSQGEVNEPCNAAYGVVALSPDGRIRPCLRADSFYSGMFKYMKKDRLMPRVINLKRSEIGALPFWKTIKKSAKDFNPAETCALEFILREGK